MTTQIIPSWVVWIIPSRKFFSAFHSVALKSNARPLFDIDGLSAIQNSDKHYEKLKQPYKEFDGNKLGYEKCLLEKREILFEILLSKENGLVSFDSKDNVDIFAGFSKTQETQ